MIETSCLRFAYFLAPFGGQPGRSKGAIPLRWDRVQALAMAASKDDIFRTALTLPEAERADLIGALIDSLDAESEAGVEEAWRMEIVRQG